MNIGNWQTSFSYPVPPEEERSMMLESGIGNCYFDIQQ